MDPVAKKAIIIILILFVICIIIAGVPVILILSSTVGKKNMLMPRGCCTNVPCCDNISFKGASLDCSTTKCNVCCRIPAPPVYIKK